jgi:hypothetical protein
MGARAASEALLAAAGRRSVRRREDRVTWQDLGSIGELISAIAVVLSLVYLAYQIRQNTSQIDQNTRAVRAAAIDSSISHAISARQAIFENQDVARIFLTGAADPEALSEEERLRYRLALYNALISLSNIFSQSRYAGLSSETWDAQIPAVQRTLSTKGGEWFWSNYGREFEASFQQEVVRVLLEYRSASVDTADSGPHAA